MSKTQDRYLFAIAALKEKYLCVRAVDVAHYLQVSKAAVSISVRQLRQMGLIQTESDGNLALTALGKERGDFLSRRVAFFQKVLADAGMDQGQALQDAVSFSWEMSDAAFATFQKIMAATECGIK